MTAEIVIFPNPQSRNTDQNVAVRLLGVETYPTDVAMDVVLEEINKLNTRLDEAVWYAVTSLTRALHFRETAKERIRNNKTRVRT